MADARLKEILGGGETVGGAQSLAFSPGGRILASGGSRLVLLWDVDTATPRTLLEESSPEYWGWHRAPVAFSPDGRILAAGGSLIRLWDTDTWELRGSLEDSPSVAFSPHGRILAGCGGSLVRLWDTDTWELRAVLEGERDEYPVLSVAFSPDGELLASGSDGTILLWDMSPYLGAPTSLGLSQPLPDRTALLASYPNPFNQEIWIPFHLHARRWQC